MNTQEPWRDLTAEDVRRIKQGLDNNALWPYILAGSVSAFLGLLAASL